MTGLRVVVSEPDCQFFTGAVDEPELLVRTPECGEVGVPLEFEPGPVEPVDSGETVSEVIVRPVDWSSLSEDVGEDSETPQEGESSDDTEDESEYLEVAREIVLEDLGHALLAHERDGSSTGQLVAKLLERKPSVPVEDAADVIHEAIRRVGLDTIEERYDDLIEAQDDSTPLETEGGSTA